MARIDEFILGPDLINLDELYHDLLRKVLEEHRGHENGITHRELCHYYFDPYPIRLEDRMLITNVLQGAKGFLQDGGWFLDYRGGQWFAAVTGEEAFNHILRYTKREVRLHHRLQAKAHIGVGTRYRLPESNPLIQAIHGMTPAIEQLEEAVNNPEPPQLEERQPDENQD
jgi:hypothetical protein